MRTQLNHILGYAELLLDDVPAEDAGSTTALADIVAAGQRATAAFAEFLQPSTLDMATSLGAVRRALATVRDEAAGLLDQAAGWDSDAAVDLDRIRSAVVRALALANDTELVGDGSPTPGPSGAGPPGSGPTAPDRPSAVAAAGGAEDEDTDTAPGAVQGVWSARGTILVVDDDPSNRDVLTRRLARMGYRTRSAVNGRQGLESIRAEHPDLVLLDLMMPEMNGYEVLEACRDDPRLRDLPIIMISARDEIDDMVDCIGLGAEDFLPKPFDPVLLEARVGACLEKKWLRDQERELLATVQEQAARLEELNRELEERVSGQVTEIERLAQLRRFVSPQVADLLLSAGDEHVLQSHRSKIAVLFCDLRGFTAFAETSEPEDVMALLGEFHAAVGAEIHRWDATVGFFAGDGLMVFFNDPIPCEAPAEQAVRLAVSMRDTMTGLTREWRKRGHDLGFGVGVGFGYATLGQMGFEGRYEYGVIGSVVNLAARLCDQAKTGQILVSGRAYLAVEDLVEAEAVGSLSLKGLHAPVSVFNVVTTRPPEG
jgi:class 3 adenylate cyclase/CheY-like chemotaxis protein